MLREGHECGAGRGVDEFMLFDLIPAALRDDFSPLRRHFLRRDAPCWCAAPFSWGPLYTPPGQNASLSPSSPARLLSIVFAVPEIPMVRHRRAGFGRTDRSVLLDTFFSLSFRYMKADPVTPYQVDRVPYKSDLVPYCVGFYR